MNRFSTALIVLVLLPGCTSGQLKRSTLDQAGTLTDLQYRQVLSNLAMLSANPSALPFHVNLRDGSAQVTDTGSAGLFGSFGRSQGSLSTGTPSVSGSRTVVEQWSMLPVSDDEELRLLRMAYHNAFGARETLSDDPDFADDLGHDLAKQTEVSLELLQDNALFQGEQARMASSAIRVDPRTTAPVTVDTNTERIAPITYRLFEKTTVTTVDKCLECDLGKQKDHEVWIEATRSSLVSKRRTYLFNHGGGDTNLDRLKVKAGDRVKWTNNDDRPHRAVSDKGGAFHFDTGMVPPGGSSPYVTFPTPSGEAGFAYVDEDNVASGTIVVTDGVDCEDEEAGEARLRTILFDGANLDNKPPLLNSTNDLIVEKPVTINVGDAVAWVNRGPNPIDVEVFDVSKNAYAYHQEGLQNSPDVNLSRAYYYSGYATPSAYIPRFFYKVTDRVTWRTIQGQVSVRHKRLQSPLVKEVCRQLSNVNDDLKEIPSGWFHVGCKKDLPKDACHVGNHGDRYAWVCPDGLADLSTFTLKVLSLSSVLKDRQVVTGSGVRYSPGLSNPGRF